MRIMIWYAGRGRARAKARELMRFAAGCFISVGAVSLAAPPAAHAVTLGELGGATFGIGGAGFVIVQLMLIALVGWLCRYVAQAAGQGQIGGMIGVTTVFLCISIVASTAHKALSEILRFMG